MKAGLDAWYVRFPDGRVLRAANTPILRRHLGAGHIPRESHVRRNPDEEWAALEWTQEFSDLAKKRPSSGDVHLPSMPIIQPEAKRPLKRVAGGVAAHLDPAKLKTIGVRRFIDELLAALDLTLVRKKLMAAGTVGLLSGLVLAMFASGLGDPEGQWLGLRAGIAGVLIFAMACVGTILVTKMTYVELSRGRPARWTESRVGLASATLRFGASYALLVGLSLAAILSLRQLAPWLYDVMTVEGSTSPLRDAVAGTVAVVALLVEIMLWPVCILSLLLAPVLVFEDRTLFAALKQWSRLVWLQLNRVLAYQALAAAVAVSFSLPFAVPLALAYFGAPREGALALPVGLSLPILAGVAAAPFFACMTVANVFVYLNVRYEYGTVR